MRVEQTSSFLLDIVSRCSKGEYGLAPFQREYAWNRNDVESLLKSLMKKWPVGSFTMWTPTEPGMYPTKGRLGPLEHPENVNELILDGQNRLASLIYASLLQTAPAHPEHPYSEREIEVWFGDEILVADFETKSISFMSPEAAWTNTRAPFGEIMDAAVFRRKRQIDVFNRMLDMGMSDESFNWLVDTVPNRVREARVTVTRLLDATLEEARECYMTICRAGQAISDEEFDRAFAYGNNTPDASTTKAPRP